MTQRSSQGGLFVALDTCIYRTHSWNFRHPFFDTLTYLAEKEYVVVLRPELVEREIARQLGRRLSRKNAAKILTAFGIQSKFGEEIENLVSRELEAAMSGYHEFHFAVDSIPVPFASADISAIMDDYFSLRAPFGSDDTSKPGKNEFPDAVLVSSLKSFAKASNGLIVLFSEDDRVRWCEEIDHLVVISDLGGLFRFLNRSEEDLDEERLTISAAEFLDVANIGPSLEAELDGRIAELDEWNHDEEEVVAYNYDVVEIDSVEVLRVEKNDGKYEISATLEFRAAVELHATVVNVDFMHYDRETGAYLWVESSSANFAHDFRELCYVTISCNSSSPNGDFKVEQVELDYSTLFVSRDIAEYHANRQTREIEFEPDYE